MAILALVAGALAVVTLVAGLLNYFGNRVEHAWYVSLIAYVSWFFPFSIVVLVPLDLASVIRLITRLFPAMNEKKRALCPTLFILQSEKKKKKSKRL